MRYIYILGRDKYLKRLFEDLSKFLIVGKKKKSTFPRGEMLEIRP